MNKPKTQDTTAEPSYQQDTRSLFYAFAASISNGALSIGERAELRRMDPHRLDCAGFWKLAGLHLDKVLPGEASARAQLETAWAAIASSCGWECGARSPVHLQHANVMDLRR